MHHSILSAIPVTEQPDETSSVSLRQNSDDDVWWLGSETDTYLLGMPQLCLRGLSESWLLKELGHRHWMLLAKLAGQKGPSFADEHGKPVYAAFCALSMRDADFGKAQENDNLRITTRLRRISRTQMMSQHQLHLSERAIGRVEMISTFVRRAPGGGNHSVSRFGVPGFPSTFDKPSTAELAGNAAAVRSGRAAEHMGFTIDDRPAHATVRFDPCPTQDFNGAGFLYFSSFVSFVDRAEWHVARELSATASTSRRDVFFSGNIDPGETLHAKVMDLRDQPGGFSHHTQLVRDQDGITLAHVFTVRNVR